MKSPDQKQQSRSDICICNGCVTKSTGDTVCQGRVHVIDRWHHLDIFQIGGIYCKYWCLYRSVAWRFLHFHFAVRSWNKQRLRSYFLVNVPDKNKKHCVTLCTPYRLSEPVPRRRCCTRLFYLATDVLVFVDICQPFSFTVDCQGIANYELREGLLLQPYNYFPFSAFLQNNHF